MLESVVKMLHNRWKEPINYTGKRIELCEHI